MTNLEPGHDLLRKRLCRQRLAAQVLAVSLFVYATLRLITAAGQFMVIRSVDPLDEYLVEAQVGVNWDQLMRCIVGLFVGGVMGTAAVMFGMYARRLREAAKGQLGADSLIQKQTCLWYAAAALGVFYILSQILRVFALPHVVWILLQW